MYSESSPKKMFSFEMRSDDGNTLISFDLPLDCTWMDIMPYFNQFLAGCGYTAKRYNRFVVESDED